MRPSLTQRDSRIMWSCRSQLRLDRFQALRPHRAFDHGCFGAVEQPNGSASSSHFAARSAVRRASVSSAHCVFWRLSSFERASDAHSWPPFPCRDLLGLNSS